MFYFLTQFYPRCLITETLFTGLVLFQMCNVMSKYPPPPAPSLSTLPSFFRYERCTTLGCTQGPPPLEGVIVMRWIWHRESMGSRLAWLCLWITTTCIRHLSHWNAINFAMWFDLIWRQRSYFWTFFVSCSFPSVILFLSGLLVDSYTKPLTPTRLWSTSWHCFLQGKIVSKRPLTKQLGDN